MKKEPLLLPKHKRLLNRFGENLKLARNRRQLSAELLAQRAGISRPTLYKIERGSPSVAMGNYFQVMQVLGLELDFELLAANDETGRRLQDLHMVTRKRAPKRKNIP